MKHSLVVASILFRVNTKDNYNFTLSSVLNEYVNKIIMEKLKWHLKMVRTKSR